MKRFLSALFALIILTGLSASCRGDIPAGSYVTFGHYPQTAEGTDDSPIEWLVLTSGEGKALLISRFVLDCQRYHTENDYYITWDKCSLREWMNGTFFRRAFTSEEQSAILPVSVPNGRDQCFTSFSASACEDTVDCVFALSAPEAQFRFGMLSSDPVFSRTAPTLYAAAHGVYVSASTRTEDGSASCVWWLRAPGEYLYDTGHIFCEAALDEYYFDLHERGVRPAIWVDTGKAGF